MCELSLENGDRLARMRRIITSAVSTIGMPSSSSGSDALAADDSFWVAMIASAPSVNPRTWLPASPMNTRAGWVLKRRNPRIAPAWISATVTTVESPLDAPSSATALRHSSTMPPARPSRPSDRFTAFVTPTRNTKVRTTDTSSGRGSRLLNVRVSIRKSPKVISATAARHWPSNLAR